MKIMKKIIVTMLCLVVFGLIFAACNDSGNGSAETSSENSIGTETSVSGGASPHSVRIPAKLGFSQKSKSYDLLFYVI